MDNTQITRVTRAQAAERAGVSERTVQRWTALGDIRVWHDPKFRKPAEYALEDVLARANRGQDLAALVETESSD